MMNQEMKVYPYIYDDSRQDAADRGSIAKGALGALIGAAIGAVPWAFLLVMGYVSALAGFLIAWLSSGFYDKFGGRRGGLKLVIVAVALVVGILLGQIVGYTLEFAQLYAKEGLAESGKSRGEFVQQTWEYYLLYDQETALRLEYEREIAKLPPEERTGEEVMTAEEFIENYYDTEVDELREELRDDFKTNGLMGLFYGLLGTIGLFVRMYRENKQRKQNAAT